MEERIEKFTKMLEGINEKIDLLYFSFKDLILESNDIDKKDVEQSINSINAQLSQFSTSLSHYRCMCGCDQSILNYLDAIETKLKFVICEIELLTACRIILDLKDIHKF